MYIDTTQHLTNHQAQKVVKFISIWPVPGWIKLYNKRSPVQEFTSGELCLLILISLEIKLKKGTNCPTQVAENRSQMIISGFFMYIFMSATDHRLFMTQLSIKTKDKNRFIASRKYLACFWLKKKAQTGIRECLKSAAIILWESTGMHNMLIAFLCLGYIQHERD